MRYAFGVCTVLIIGFVARCTGCTDSASTTAPQQVASFGLMNLSSGAASCEFHVLSVGTSQSIDGVGTLEAGLPDSARVQDLTFSVVADGTGVPPWLNSVTVGTGQRARTGTPDAHGVVRIDLSSGSSPDPISGASHRIFGIDLTAASTAPGQAAAVMAKLKVTPSVASPYLGMHADHAGLFSLYDGANAHKSALVFGNSAVLLTVRSGQPNGPLNGVTGCIAGPSEVSITDVRAFRTDNSSDPLPGTSATSNGGNFSITGIPAIARGDLVNILVVFESRPIGQYTISATGVFAQ